MRTKLATIVAIAMTVGTACVATAQQPDGAKHMEFPKISEEARLARLEPPRGKVRMVLDTDTYNEIDDQFAVVYALLSPEQLDVEALYAAPFHNKRSSGPGDGMEKSYEEILRLLGHLGVSPEGFVHRGSTGFLEDGEHPYRSEAALDLIERAMAPDKGLLYVAAVGAITNVASAILIEPAIVDRIVVVWLGGQPQYWPDSREFNLAQDPQASRVIFDSGVPLVRIPCSTVASHLITTVPEMECYVQGRGAIGDYLVQIFKEYHEDHYAWSKVIWDISAIAWLIESQWIPTKVLPSPILTDEITWKTDPTRHVVREATFVSRDPVFKDLFTKLERAGEKAKP
ncbi:MAG TPA: nucleoside hydrolase [Candidatus Hydrogenedentes bacterium]|nr:nucleoside hydrolase [Candidatus Hydrogenedentota bacterium]